MQLSTSIRRLLAVILLACACVTLIPQSARAEDEILQAQEETLYYTASYVHYSAGTGSTKIGCMENGTRLTVLGEKGEFYKIDCFDMTGYIAKSQVRQDENGDYVVDCQGGSKETATMQGFTAQQVLDMRSALCSLAVQYIGRPYVLGGNGPWGFDCSGYTKFLYAKLGIDLDRNQNEQLHDGLIVAKEDMQPGDLVFFQGTTGYGAVSSHVGMYIGNGQMIHAGSQGIAIVSLDQAYFVEHYLCSRRIIISDVAQSVTQAPLGLGQSMNSSYWRGGFPN